MERELTDDPVQNNRNAAGLRDSLACLNRPLTQYGSARLAEKIRKCGPKSYEALAGPTRKQRKPSQVATAPSETIRDEPSLQSGHMVLTSSQPPETNRVIAFASGDSQVSANPRPIQTGEMAGAGRHEKGPFAWLPISSNAISIRFRHHV